MFSKLKHLNTNKEVNVNNPVKIKKGNYEVNLSFIRDTACTYANHCPIRHTKGQKYILDCDDCKADKTDDMTCKQAKKWWEERIKQLPKEKNNKWILEKLPIGKQSW